MKLVTFEVQTQVGPFQRTGVVLDEELTDAARIADLNFGYTALLLESGEPRAYEAAAALLPPDMLGYLEGGDASHQRARQVLDFVQQRPQAKGPRGETLVYARNQVKLLAPLPRPLSARDYTTYEEHMSTRNPEKRPPFYYFPSCYKASTGSIYGTDDPIIYPAFTEWLDPELEYAVVVNKRGRNIRIEDGMQYVGGYTIWLDCSARDQGARETLGPTKSKDFCTILGPCIATPDSFNEENARCGIRVNGETWYEGNVGHKRHYFTPELIAYASDGEDIVPGDLIVSGTIGFGCSIDLGKWLQPGDVVQHWIEGIGTIKTNVVKEENPNSYVLNGLPGRLPIPDHAKGFLDELSEQARMRRESGHARPRADEVAAR